MTLTRIRFRTAARAGAMTLLTDFKEEFGLKLQIYPGRPRSVNPPTAFIDRISETLDDYAGNARQRHPRVEVVVLHGLFDSKEAVDQGDEFVDDFLDWVADRFHAFGARTLVEVTDTSDEPDYLPDWLPPDQQRTYYATRLTLEGFAAT